MEEEERTADGRGREKRRWKRKREEWVEEQNKKSLCKRKREEQMEEEEKRADGRGREKSRWKKKRKE